MAGRNKITLLEGVIFNFLIGNNDAHGKNFSFIYESESGRHTARLAPLYDLVSTSHYPELSPNMAMKIGSRYASHQVRLSCGEAVQMPDSNPPDVIGSGGLLDLCGGRIAPPINIQYPHTDR